MLHALRRSSVLLLWLAFALLPLRGWASAAMHLPASANEVAAVVASLPCHGDAGGDTDGAEPSIEADAACQLCDLCHGAALPLDASPAVDRHLPLRVAVALTLPLETARQTLFRPPRA